MNMWPDDIENSLSPTLQNLNPVVDTCTKILWTFMFVVYFETQIVF